MLCWRPIWRECTLCKRRKCWHCWAASPKFLLACLPLQRMARLSPRASAVPELMFSTRRCFTFFSTVFQKRYKQHTSRIIATPCSKTAQASAVQNAPSSKESYNLADKRKCHRNCRTEGKATLLTAWTFVGGGNQYDIPISKVLPCFGSAWSLL